MRKTATYDFQLIGFNIRCSRMAQSKTQSELARDASVDRATVRRLEAGRAVHHSSLEKICLALGRPVSIINSLMPYGEPGKPRAAHLHRREDLVWFSHGDQRKSIPANNKQLLQSQEERNRLARLGWVDMFEAYSVTMPYGPSVSYAEVCGEVSLGNHRTYRTCIIVGLVGETIVGVEGDEFPLSPGDMLGFDAAKSASIRPTDASQNPPLVMLIMGNRTGHVPIVVGHMMRQRIRRRRS